VKLLLDECIDERLRFLFAGHDCQTSRFASLAGLKNGQLLDAAEAAGFEVLIRVGLEIGRFGTRITARTGPEDLRSMAPIIATSNHVA
jgi:hypothetical protein